MRVTNILGLSSVSLAALSVATPAWAAGARARMTSLRLMRHWPYPLKIFSETSEAAKWAAGYAVRTGQSEADAAVGIFATIEELRRNSFAPHK